MLGETARLSAETRDIWLPPLFSTPVIFFSHGSFAVTLTLNQIAQCAAATMLLIVASLALTKTTAGRTWRAVSDDPFAAQLIGVNSGRTLHLSVLVGSALAAMAGAFAALHYGNISFGTDAEGAIFAAGEGKRWRKHHGRNQKFCLHGAIL